LIDELTMKCHKIGKKLSAYQDGELSASEKELLERHLAGCHACREQYVKLQQTWQALGEMAEIRPTLGFYDRVSQEIREASKDNGFGFFDWRHWRLRTLMPPVAVPILLAIGIFCGALIGNSFVKIHPPPSTTAHAEEGFLSSLRVFGPVPPGTLADNYERLLSYNESHNR
jgi:anti-sigma factor RsiW